MFKVYDTYACDYVRNGYTGKAITWESYEEARDYIDQMVDDGVFEENQCEVEAEVC